MKIAFAGCSFTWGDELENPEEQRFSRLVCNKLGAEEINVSRCGWSNDLILHKFLKYCTSTEGAFQGCGKPDVAVIQWTTISRWQIWDDSQNDWESIIIQMAGKKLPPKTKNVRNNPKRWNAFMYYRHVYSDQHGIENYWKNIYLAEQYCKDNDIKLIMMNNPTDKPTIDYVSPYQSLCKNKIHYIKAGILPYSNKMKPDELKEYYMEKTHPSPKGHQMIADYVEEQIQLLNRGNS